tara:strand:- start:309 stop:1637 length:1329 start_codon:yes stop_codon:yes gene_type:complete
MDNKPATPSRRPRPERQAHEGLANLSLQGASVRRHRYFRDALAFFFPVLITVALQAIIYLAFFTRTARDDWNNAAATVIILGFAPIFAAVTLSAFRRHEAPIMATIAVVAIFFSFAVTFLAALRIPVTYAGLAATLPAAMLIMAVANIRFHAALSARVALIEFSGDAAAHAMLNDTTIALITHPDTDISSFDTVLIDPTQHHTTQWSNLLARCYVAGVDIMPWTRFMEIRLGRVHVPDFDISHLTYTPSQLIYARTKRLLDLAAVVVTLPLAIPFATLTALYIFLRDGAPVLFIQHRRGLTGRVFRMYKFRTMYQGTGGDLTTVGDKRIIPGGRLIRKLRLDELPQLYNILIGDMSLIGPRPVAEYVARSSIKHEGKYALRNLVLPGITGWAQVTSGYAATTEEEIEKLAYDLYYIKHLSFDLDLQILFKTVRTVLFGTGAR